MDYYRNPWKRRHYGSIIIISALVLSLYIFSPFALEGKVIICPFRNMTGLPCPGCGMTRAASSIAHGEFARALSLHIFSPLFYLALIAELVNSIVAIARKGRPLFIWNELWAIKPVKYIVWIFITTIVSYNFYRIAVLFHQSTDVISVFHDSIFLRVIRIFM